MRTVLVLLFLLTSANIAKAQDSVCDVYWSFLYNGQVNPPLDVLSLPRERSIWEDRVNKCKTNFQRHNWDFLLKNGYIDKAISEDHISALYNAEKRSQILIAERLERQLVSAKAPDSENKPYDLERAIRRLSNVSMPSDKGELIPEIKEKITEILKERDALIASYWQRIADANKLSGKEYLSRLSKYIDNYAKVIDSQEPTELLVAIQAMEALPRNADIEQSLPDILKSELRSINKRSTEVLRQLQSSREVILVAEKARRESQKEEAELEGWIIGVIVVAIFIASVLTARFGKGFVATSSNKTSKSSSHSQSTPKAQRQSLIKSFPKHIKKCGNCTYWVGERKLSNDRTAMLIDVSNDEGRGICTNKQFNASGKAKRRPWETCKYHNPILNR